MLPCNFTAGNLTVNENYVIIKKKKRHVEFVGKNSRFLEIKRRFLEIFKRFSKFLYLGPLCIFMTTIEYLIYL